MANLKLDIINKVKNDHYYNEMEFSRLAQDPMINYELKVKKMSQLLDTLTLTTAKLAQIELYFAEPTTVPPDEPTAKADHVSQPLSQPLPGQSHGE